MAKVLSIDINTAKKIISDLEQLEELKRRILRFLPEEIIPYGSRLWWDKEIITGEEEIKKREFKTYKNPKTLLSDLHKRL